MIIVLLLALHLIVAPQIYDSHYSYHYYINENEKCSAPLFFSAVVLRTEKKNQKRQQQHESRLSTLTLPAAWDGRNESERSGVW
jgi:hypothetical protein